MSEQEKTIKDAEGLREALTVSLSNLVIPRNTMVVHAGLKKLVEQTAMLVNKPSAQLFGMNVIVSEMFPFKMENGTIVNGAMYNSEGHVVWLIQGAV